MVTTLYLVRHGDVEGSDAKRYYGTIDIPLSEKGVEQVKGASVFIARHLVDHAAAQRASYLNDINRPDKNRAIAGRVWQEKSIAAIYCSDLQRAVRSAEIIAAPHSLVPIKLPALRERNFGIWEGMSFIEIKERYPREFDAWSENPVRYNPPGGENTLEVSARVVAAVEQILDDHGGEKIAIVAHGGVNRLILCHSMGIPLENIFRIEQDYAAVSIVEFWDKYPVVKLLNGNGGIVG
ncbi:MAG TPA: histidine phosphatase family protein [Syntrophorhabdales bacterium]|nr:histidine phosphatase family protein [Syntrophorhabdales bacterium]